MSSSMSSFFVTHGREKTDTAKQIHVVESRDARMKERNLIAQSCTKKIPGQKICEKQERAYRHRSHEDHKDIFFSLSISQKQNNRSAIRNADSVIRRKVTLSPSLPRSRNHKWGSAYRRQEKVEWKDPEME